MPNKLYTEIHTILDLLRWTSSQLNAAELFYGHGTNNFWDETLHLVLPTLHLPIYTPQKMYYAHVTRKERTNIIKLVINRVNTYTPVPYLTNQAWFCGLKFYVDNRVFIPRSPIGELITSCFYNIPLHKDPTRILDMCTGSGSIAVAVAMIYPNSEIDAVDISTEALKVAEYNIQSYNLENRITPICSNLFNKLSGLKYDLIITNPPYINNLDVSKLPKEFHHEPVLSLSAGNNELTIIDQILMNSANYLNPHGILICEVGISKQLLIKKYPNISFHWINFSNGGEGVFMLNHHELLFFTKNTNPKN